MFEQNSKANGQYLSVIYNLWGFQFKIINNDFWKSAHIFKQKHQKEQSEKIGIENPVDRDLEARGGIPAHMGKKKYLVEILKAKIPIPAASQTGFPLHSNRLRGTLI